jgi:hypothetical protein
MQPRKTTIMQCYLFIPGLFALFCAGCSGGGGETPPANNDVQLGSRILPSGTVTVTSLTPLVAGKIASFRINIPDLAGVTTVEALLGNDYDNTLPITVNSEGPRTWHASVLLPDPLPATNNVLVRLTDETGAIMETGIDDFAIVNAGSEP